MIRVGVGGWSFEPWRGVFYPEDLPHAQELAFASRQVTAIEINSTFYRTQSHASFAKWRETAPEDFIFAVKAHRAIVSARWLAEAGEKIEHFLESGVMELGDKLGPLLWQLPPHKAFDAEEIGAFLKLLPKRKSGRPLRHALEIRHESFLDAQFVALLREENVAAVFVDGEDHPAIADATADFVYARLRRTREDCATGYEPEPLALWEKRVRSWESGETPADLPLLAEPAARRARDVFVFMIDGAKVRAPAAAMALIARLGRG
ncbi:MULTISPECIES: DUF72 domain-containing protein [Methylosinus]|uniref:DUF72 domain-containing protein n=1 Tax=Methylosinus trichosporium (strain ATCC 35070 / NCIMB 11131 / UNIQEM 75 / OB3b) TaxID=595536 RepID=A0A2D2CZ75_METT3|nr:MULTISPECIES: DUF72 domain-containing protein [Methylosinus]ATQ68051.1 DUF72 domain-containing protein [Methylosinus trichosporium OB3b]OBS53677.1 hypothetical protein A8B73_03980 [Methylosinus sp. 3S-1]